MTKNIHLDRIEKIIGYNMNQRTNELENQKKSIFKFPKYIFTRILTFVTYSIGVLLFIASNNENSSIFSLGFIAAGVFCFLIADAIKIILDIEANTRSSAENSIEQLRLVLDLQKTYKNFNNEEPKLKDGYKFCTNCGNQCEKKLFECILCGNRFEDGEFKLN